MKIKINPELELLFIEHYCHMNNKTFEEAAQSVRRARINRVLLWIHTAISIVVWVSYAVAVLTAPLYLGFDASWGSVAAIIAGVVVCFLFLGGNVKLREGVFSVGWKLRKDYRRLREFVSDPANGISLSKDLSEVDPDELKEKFEQMMKAKGKIVRKGEAYKASSQDKIERIKTKLFMKRVEEVECPFSILEWGWKGYIPD